jgi:drug/metabolite transporter (DMT)-like permease
VTLQSAARHDRPLRGIALALLFAMMACHLDAMSKWFSQYYPVLQLVWIRYTALTIAFLVALPFLGWRRVVMSSVPRLQIARGAALWASATLFLAGLSYLPLTTTQVIGKTAPLIVAAISLPILGERVGLNRWAAILIGFAGLLVVVRPDFGTIHWAMLFPLGTACAYAGYQLMTRYATGVDSSLTSLFYTAVVGCALASLAAPFVWVTPTLPHLALLFVHGLGVGLGHFVLIRAFTHAPASLLAPLSYTGLIWAVILGYVVFDEIPDWGTLIGGALITAAGIYLARSATQEKKS